MTEDTDLTRFIVDALEDLKALDIRIVDVRGQTSVTDFLVIASGTSSRHVKSLADHVAHEMKAKHGVGALGSEGADAAEWVLVDFDSVVLHVMNMRTSASLSNSPRVATTGSRPTNSGIKP